MRLLCGFFKPGFQVFVVMSLVVWGSVKHCLISREQCFTPFLFLCVEPVLGANKAGLQAVQMRAGRKGALDSIWRPCGSQGSSWAQCLVHSYSLFLPPARDTLPLGHCKGALVQLSTCPFVPANRGDSSRQWNTEVLFVWVPILQETMGCLKLH